MSQSRSPKPTTDVAVPEIMNEKELAKALGANSVETVNTVPQYDSAALVKLETWDDVAALLETAGVEVQIASQVLGDGFAVLDSEDKMSLIGKKMMFLEWRFNQGDMGEFVSIRAIVAVDNGIRRVIINDGSTGIREQLRKFTDSTGVQSGLYVEKGLRVSKYLFEDPKTGVQRPAETYYLDTSAA